MNEIISIALLVLGAIALLLAAVGVMRMPDVYMRMQAATKASPLGIICIMLAAAFHFGEVSVVARALATIMFFFITTPVTAQLIARAAYVIGTPMWEGTIIDDLAGCYDKHSHTFEQVGSRRAVEQEHFEA